MLLAASAAAIRLCRSMATGAALLVVVYLIGALSAEPAGFLFGGFNVYLEDMAGGAICLAALLRLAMRPSKAIVR